MAQHHEATKLTYPNETFVKPDSETLEKLGISFKEDRIEFANQTDCCICQETLMQSSKKIVTTPCKHQFHESCIWVWFKQKLDYNVRLRSGEIDDEE